MEDGLTKHGRAGRRRRAAVHHEGRGRLLPDLSKFDEAFVTQLAKGFDISSDAVGVWGAAGLAYLCVAFVVGYFFLKTREVAK